MHQAENIYGRLDAIERMLANSPDGRSTGELALEFGVDADTIRRDLMRLEDLGTGLVKIGRRYLIDHRRSFHRVKLTNDEALALYLAARLLSRHSDEHNPHVVKALEKLADALGGKSPLIAGHIARAADAVRARQIRPEYVEALEAITHGWAEGRKIWLRYRSSKNQITERVFAPYYLEPSGIGYACYVIGYDDLRAEIRTLKVERIAEARITDQRFVIPSSFSPQQQLSNAWGVIWRDAGETEVTLHFMPAVVQRLKESVWHHSQRLEDLSDGSCLFTVRVGSTLEMKPWIRQWGADVKVVSPPELRHELIDEVRAMARAYGLSAETEMP